MIPKIIHYCWFGRNLLPELALRCIESWKKYLPDYEIKEWNEDNYDVRKIPYIAEAYDAKKYAFVSDYARFDILYEYGGIYFDTDVEVIKDLTPIIEQGAFAGVECAGSLAAGLGIASPAAMVIFKEVLDSYQEEHFLNQDGSLNLKTVVTRVSEVFYKHGFVKEDKIQDVAGVRVYPTEYFCPKSYFTNQLNITEKSYTIHWYDGSWLTYEAKKRASFRQKVVTTFGENFFQKFLCIIYNFFSLIREIGFVNVIKKYKEKLRTKLIDNDK